MTTPHERSVGAAMERKAMRRYLRRKMRVFPVPGYYGDALQETLDWLLSRQQRYDAKPGGLGKR